jgi:hypothetical protein
LQIRSDVERQGDFIRFLIKEVEGAAFADIDDVVTFVKWLDVELSRLVMQDTGSHDDTLSLVTILLRAEWVTDNCSCSQLFIPGG